MKEMHATPRGGESVSCPASEASFPFGGNRCAHPGLRPWVPVLP